jgi:hypothetical protein
MSGTGTTGGPFVNYGGGGVPAVAPAVAPPVDPGSNGAAGATATATPTTPPAVAPPPPQGDEVFRVPEDHPAAGWKFTQPWFDTQLEQGTAPGLDWQGASPADLYAQYQGLPPDVRQAYVDRYMRLNPGEQQQWLNAFGQPDPKGGYNNPKFGSWFNTELDQGRPPGLAWQGTAPADLYAQYQALPPEMRAAYVERYLRLTPEEQAGARAAFGQPDPAAEPAPAAAAPGWSLGGEGDYYYQLKAAQDGAARNAETRAMERWMDRTGENLGGWG